MAPIGVGILGTGMALSFLHYPCILCNPDKFKLVSVMERVDRGRVKALCGDGVKSVRTLEEVLNDPEVDMVVVGTPNITHFEYATKALKAGKHILIEKPVTPTIEEAISLQKLVAEKGLIISVYQNRRWDSDFLTVKEIVESGRLGPLTEFTSKYDRYRPIPPKSGTATWKETPGEYNEGIYNLGSHIIDQAYTLFGMPESIWCRVWHVRGVGLDESFEAHLTYPPKSPSQTPLKITLSSSILSAAPNQLRFEVKGSKGSYVKYGLDPQGRDLQRIVKEPGWDKVGFGEEDPEEYGTICEAIIEGEPGVEGEKGEGKEVMGQDGVKFRVSKYKSKAGNYPALYANLYEAISQNDPEKLEAKIGQSIDVLRIILGGMESSKEGKLVKF